jgi:hypothetical protein
MNAETNPLIENELRFFLDVFDEADETAEGRACFPLAENDCALLDRMARGQCGKEERKTAIDLLVSNREAMEYFACALNGNEYVPVGGG